MRMIPFATALVLALFATESEAVRVEKIDLKKVNWGKVADRVEQGSKFIPGPMGMAIGAASGQIGDILD